MGVRTEDKQHGPIKRRKKQMSGVRFVFFSFPVPAEAKMIWRLHILDTCLWKRLEGFVKWQLAIVMVSLMVPFSGSVLQKSLSYWTWPLQS